MGHPVELGQRRRPGLSAITQSLVVVVLVPIALGAPAVLVFIPPAVPFGPAVLAGCVQFAALVIGLTTVASVLFDGLVEFMVRVGDPALTAVDIFGMKGWSAEG
jgi:hypothetical protein